MKTNQIPYIDSKTMEIPVNHCCKMMTGTVTKTSMPLDKQGAYVCPVVCSPSPVRYKIEDRGGESLTGILYCPWCGQGLPGCDEQF